MPLLTLHGSPTLQPAPGAAAGPVVALAAREAALLAWLHLEGPTPRAAIASRLWPAGTEAQARANLRQTLRRLRLAAGAVIAEHDGVLALDPAVTLAEGGGRLLGTLEFDDTPELAAWLAARREAEQRERHRTGLARGRAALDGGDLDEALAEADRLLADDPAIEEAHRLRMEALFLRGDRAAAIAAWDQCRLALRAAFGIAPSAATQALGAMLLEASAPPPPVQALPGVLQAPPRLVGREALLAEARRALELGRALVVAGPGGIGKSRLLAEIATGRPAGSVLVVGARAGDAVLPGALIARLVQGALRRFEPALPAGVRADLQTLLRPAAATGAAPASARDRERVLGSVAALLAACAARGLVAVAIDDLQFADDESVAALTVVAGHWLAAVATGAAPAAPLPLIGLRPDELTPPGRRLIDRLAGSGRCTRIDLGPLEADAVRALIDSLPLADAPTPALGRVARSDALREALAAALHAQLGGSPAFVLELLRHLWVGGADDALAAWSPGGPLALPVPPSLHESVRQRLAALPAEALQLAQLAAVAGPEFSLSMAGAALGRAPLALAPLIATLEQAQVFRGPRFAHDLVAEAVRASMPAALAAALHGLVAEQLVMRANPLDRQESHPGPEVPAAAIAHHLDAAGAAARAAPWHRTAALHARARWQMPEAARSFEAAARHFASAGAAGDEPSREAAVDAWREAARCWSRADEDERAGTALEHAAALARGAREVLLVTSTRIAQRINARRHDEAVAAARELVGRWAEARVRLDGAERAEAARFVCACVPYGLPIDDALAVADAAIAEGDPPLPPRVHAEVAAAVGAALHWDARLERAEAELASAWRALAPAAAGAAGSDDAALRITAGNRLARVRHSLGDLDGALAVGEEALAWAERLPAGLGAITDLMQILALMQFGHGRPAAGWARLESTVALLAAGRHPLGLATQTSRALAALGIGDAGLAFELLATVEPPPPTPGHALGHLALDVARARAAAARGDDPAEPVQRLRALLGRRTAGIAIGPALQLRATLLQWTPWSAIATDGTPGPHQHESLPALRQALQARGMRSLLRCALGAAAARALDAAAIEPACRLAREALELDAHVDFWCEEPAALWLTAVRAFAAAGDAAAAEAVRRRARARIERAARGFADAAQAGRYRTGHPVHRALITG